MIIYNKKLHFSFIILLILVTCLNSTNYSNVKINQQQNK